MGLPEPTVWALIAGGFAVHGFFAISGYLITRSFMNTPRFGISAAHRVLRIMPGLIATLVFMRLCWLACNRFDPLLHNGPLWTLPWEAACYVACAFVGIVGTLNKRNFGLICAGVWIFNFANIGNTSDAFAYIAPMFMLFMGGAFIGIFDTELNMRMLAGVSAIVLVALAVPDIRDPLTAAFRGLGFENGVPLSITAIQRVPYLIALPFVMIYLGAYARPIPFTKKDMSYGVYIYGWPVQIITGYAAYVHGHRFTSILVYFFAVMPVVLLLAFLSWEFIEKPTLSLKTLFRRTPIIAA